MTTTNTTKVYSTITEVTDNEVRPLITPYEDDFDVFYLMDNLVASCFDSSGHLKGYGLRPVSDAERNQILGRAFYKRFTDNNQS